MPPVALRQCGEPPLAFYVADKMLHASDSTCLPAGEGLFKIAIWLGRIAREPNRDFKWQWRHATARASAPVAAPRVVDGRAPQRSTVFIDASG